MVRKREENGQLDLGRTGARRFHRLSHIVSVGITTVADEVKRTGDSAEIVRADIDYLEQELPFIKFLDQKGRGRRRETIVAFGLTPLPELNFQDRFDSAIDSKTKVAQFIINKVNPLIDIVNDTIFLDGGTAALYVAAEIAKLVTLPGQLELKVVTNNPLVLNILHGRVSLLKIVGGELTPGKHYILSPEYDFSHENLTKALMGTNSIWYEEGVSCLDRFIKTKLRVLEAVNEIIFLADHTKIRRPTEARHLKLCTFQELHNRGNKFTVVTDSDQESLETINDEKMKFHNAFGEESFICVED